MSDLEEENDLMVLDFMIYYEGIHDMPLRLHYYWRCTNTTMHVLDYVLLMFNLMDLPTELGLLILSNLTLDDLENDRTIAMKHETLDE